MLLMAGKGRIFSNTSNLLNNLLSALTGGVISNSHSLYNTSDNNPNTVLSGDLPEFFTNDENTNYTTAAPKAFFKYLAFDNQLNLPTLTGRHERCQLWRATSSNYHRK
ncbi:MAG: hypothetical protein EPN39_09480 [Chitinophagaceae bacterium]|nr:MAG: hypothetical protein EPN39_09480 [Chitinophagaceae bacterium]